MEHIPTTENGLEATRKRENELHPLDGKGKKFPWWDRRAHVLQLLLHNVNELVTAHDTQGQTNQELRGRVEALEARPPAPFPGRS